MHRRITLGLMGIALSLATVMVVWLARSNRSLILERNELFRVATQAHRGMYVPTFDATALSGAAVTLGAPDSRQLLYFFTTTCPYCRASLPAWKDLAVEATRQGVPVLGVALDSVAATERYRSEHGLAFPIVVLHDTRMTALYRATRVPLTLLVGEGGRIEQARTGELTDSAAIDSLRLALSRRSEFTTTRPTPMASSNPTSAAVRVPP